MIQMRFIQSASDWRQFSQIDRPQVAIAGRSNSGKSSFINLLGRGKHAMVSSTPGKTRLLNFFDVDGRFVLVDMPGYGYAARGRSERRQWESMVESYLGESPNLKGLILLMDVRRKWAEEEQMLADYCVAMEIPLLIGLTKADKLSRSAWQAAQKTLSTQVDLPVFCLSSLKKWGALEILGHIRKQWLKAGPAMADLVTNPDTPGR
jgi:GTP-binding protein